MTKNIGTLFNYKHMTYFNIKYKVASKMDKIEQN